MQNIDYLNQTLQNAEAELRRLFIVGITLKQEDEKKYKQRRQLIIKAFFKQFETYKKLYAKTIAQKP